MKLYLFKNEIKTKRSSDRHNSGSEQFNPMLSSQLSKENKLKSGMQIQILSTQQGFTCLLGTSQTSTNVIALHSTSPTDTITKDESISLSPMSTKGVHSDIVFLNLTFLRKTFIKDLVIYFQDKTISRDNSSQIHDSMEKEPYRSPSSYVSRKSTDNNETGRLYA